MLGSHTYKLAALAPYKHMWQHIFSFSGLENIIKGLFATIEKKEIKLTTLLEH